MADTGFDISKIVDDAIAVATKPAQFYRGMAKTGGYGQPLVFVVAMAVVAAIIMMLLSFVGLGAGGMAAGFLALIVTPIVAVVATFIAAVIMFVIWKLLGSGESYETAFRCVAYAMAIFPVTAIFQTVPYLGSILSIAWYMYLMAVAGNLVHGIEQKKAYIVFGVLGLVFILLNINGEMRARQMRAAMEQMHQDPQALGNAVNEMLKGLQQNQTQ